MNNKSTMIASIVGFVVVALVLGIVKEKREKKEKRMTDRAYTKALLYFRVLTRALSFFFLHINYKLYYGNILEKENDIYEKT